MYLRIALLLLLLSFSSSNSYAYEHRQKIDSLKALVKKCADSSKAPVYHLLSYHYLRISSDSSEMYANKGIEWAKEYINEQEEAKCYTVLGVIEKNKGDYEAAIAYHLKSLKLSEKNNMIDGAAITNNSIGIIYKQMKQWDKALEYYRRSNQLTKDIKMDRGISMTYNNIGTIYQKKGHWDSALFYFDSALHYAEQSGYPGTVATALANIGEVYMNEKEYSKALNTFLRCLKEDKKNEDKYGMAISYQQVGRAYKDMGKATIAAEYLDSAETIAKEAGLIRELSDIYIIRTETEEAKGNYKKALAYKKIYEKLNDSMLNVETTRQVAELQTKYETEKKEQQIILQKAEISKRNYIIAGISSLLLLTGLLGYSSYNRYKLRQKDKLQKEIIKQQELATQAVIEAEEQERKRIAGDLHDGVGQTMSAAKMNLSVISSDLPFKDEEQRLAFDKAIALVDEGCTEVRAVSHQIMPNALLKTGLGTAIGEFLNKIDSKVLKVSYYSEGLDERLPSNVETVLYRVVQECVNNVIKHADADALDMTLIKDGDGISVTIEDNGKGFDPNTAMQKKGIGLQNLMTRIKYLKGDIEWDTAPGKGTVVTIQVPVEAT